MTGAEEAGLVEV